MLSSPVKMLSLQFTSRASSTTLSICCSSGWLLFKPETERTRRLIADNKNLHLSISFSFFYNCTWCWLNVENHCFYLLLIFAWKMKQTNEQLIKTNDSARTKALLKCECLLLFFGKMLNITQSVTISPSFSKPFRATFTHTVNSEQWADMQLGWGSRFAILVRRNRRFGCLSDGTNENLLSNNHAHFPQ